MSRKIFHTKGIVSAKAQRVRAWPSKEYVGLEHNEKE